MRFLVDESCDFAVVRALRAAGHEILAAAEVAGGAEDDVIIELARSEQRILLTEDKDFGHLVFAAARQSAGVVLIRWPVSARSSMGVAVVEFVHGHQSLLTGAFVVLEPGRVRFARVP